MSDDVASNVREAFQGRRGKILIIGGGVAIAGYVWYTRRTGTPETPIGETPGELVPSGRTGGRNPQTDPEVGNTETGSVKPGRPTSNAAWLSDGVDFLIGRGTPSASAFDTLTKALGGQPLNAQQIAWVGQVISALGSPPEGMPPLNAGAPPGNPQAPSKGGGAAAIKIVNAKVAGVTQTAVTLKWQAIGRPDLYRVYLNGSLKSSVVGPATNLRNLKRATTYTASIAPVLSRVEGPRVHIRFTTKK